MSVQPRVLQCTLALTPTRSFLVAIARPVDNILRTPYGREYLPRPRWGPSILRPAQHREPKPFVLIGPGLAVRTGQQKGGDDESPTFFSPLTTLELARAQGRPPGAAERPRNAKPDGLGGSGAFAWHRSPLHSACCLSRSPPSGFAI